MRFTPIFIFDGRIDMDAIIVRIERTHNIIIAFFDKSTAQFASARQLVIIRIQFLVKIGKFHHLGQIRQEITNFPLANMSAAQRHYAGPERQMEELYDCVLDPHNVTNLASSADPKHQQMLNHMRAQLAERCMELSDQGAIPESLVHERSFSVSDIANAWKAASSATRADFSSSDPIRRYWAVIRARQDKSTDLTGVSSLLSDESPPVRVEAASWLASMPESLQKTKALQVLVDELDAKPWIRALHACRAIELLGDDASSVKSAMRAVYDRTRPEKGDANLFLAFSSGAFLDDLGEDTTPWDFTPKD